MKMYKCLLAHPAEGEDGVSGIGYGIDIGG